MVDVSNLSKEYKIKVAKRKKKEMGASVTEFREEKVRDITFSLKENEVMGILGPSGAGKS